MSIHVRSYPESRQLFLAVFLHVAFSSFFGVISSVKRVAPGGVCMMPRFFVPPAFMMFGCLTVMMRGMRTAAFLWCSAAFFDKNTILCSQTRGVSVRAKIERCMTKLSLLRG
jgi:hypothetical protein